MDLLIHSFKKGKKRSSLALKLKTVRHHPILSGFNNGKTTEVHIGFNSHNKYVLIIFILWLSNFCHFWYDFVDQDACFTSDSDAFLFGARTVYREICLGKTNLFLLPVHGDAKRKSIPVCSSYTKSITYIHLRWRWLCYLLWNGWHWEKTGIWKEFLGIFFALVSNYGFYFAQYGTFCAWVFQVDEKINNLVLTKMSLRR